MLSISLLSIALLFNAALNERNGRVIACLICLIPVCIFELSVHYFPMVRGDGDAGLYFYILAAAMSLSTVGALQFVRRSPLVVDIQVINIVAMLIHCYGIYVWDNELSSAIYTGLILSAIIIEWLRLMKRTITDGVYWSNVWLLGLNGDDNCSAKRGDS